MMIVIVFIIILGSSNCLNLCEDWIQYEDLKCFKVLEKKGIEEEALGNCTQLEQSSTLITIHSKEEQEFLNNILNKFNNISQNSWIGIKYLDKTYKWMDNSINNYTNWSEDAVKDGTDTCAQMSLSGNSLGKWTDVSCKKPALIVCQKNVEISMTLLKNIIEKQQIENNVKLEKQEKKIEELETKSNKQQAQINSIIPIGFIYTQLPNTSAPQELWPQFKWSEVTAEYSGLFFRAEGGESLPFKQIQSQNQSWISNVYLHGAFISSEGQDSGYWTSLSQGELIDANRGEDDGTCYFKAIDQLKFYTTSGEVRPKNTAIKIFKRI